MAELCKLLTYDSCFFEICNKTVKICLVERQVYLLVDRHACLLSASWVNRLSLNSNSSYDHLFAFVLICLFTVNS